MKMNKLGKRLFIVTVSILFLGQAIFIVGPNAHAADTGNNIKDVLNDGDSLLTDFDVSYTEPLTVDDNIDFHFDFAIPEYAREQIHEGDYYEIELPSEFVIAAHIDDIPLYDSEGNLYGYVQFESGTNKLKIVFTDYVQQLNDIEGSFDFDGQLNPDAIGGPGDIEVEIPGETTIPPVILPIKPVNGSTIEKSGHFNKEVNASEVTWFIDVNKALDELNNIVVTENLPDGLTLTSFEIYESRYDFDGNFIENVGAPLVLGTDYEVNPNGSIHFLNSPTSASYRIYYHTTIDEDVIPTDGGSLTFTNNATLQSDEVDPLETESTITTQYHEPLIKNGSYDPYQKIVTWTIEYNYNEQNIDALDAILDDVFGNANLTFVEDSLHIQGVTFADDGSEIVGNSLVEGTDYDLVSGANGFHINFHDNVTGAFKITYETYYDGIIDDTITLNNTVTDGTGHTGDGNVNAPQKNLVKDKPSVDQGTREATWTIHVNQAKEEMHNWKLHDVMDEHLSLITSSLEIKDLQTNLVLTEGVDYTVFSDNANIFDIVFIGSYSITSDEFTITYKTFYEISSTGPSFTYANNASGVWTDQYGDEHINNSGNSFKLDDPTINNGLKKGSYNAQTKLITWSIATNYNEGRINQATLRDPITGNQQYVLGSLRIYGYTIAGDGSIVRDENPIADTEKNAVFAVEEPSETNGQVLSIEYISFTSKRYLFEFDTSLEGQIVKDESEYTNIATFQDVNGEEYQYEAEVAIANGGKFASKTGEQDEDGYAVWDVTINPSQSTLNNVNIVDTPSSNQQIQEDSIIIYGTTITPEGVITKNESVTLVVGVDYEVSYTQNGETGLWELHIQFLHQISLSYILEYKAKVIVDVNESDVVVTNGMTITGDNVETIIEDDSDSFPIDIGKGSGVAHGTKGMVDVYKIDMNGQSLMGAQFQLYDDQGQKVGGVASTDAAGVIHFSEILYGTYTLKEIVTAPGYSISQELSDGIAIEVNEQTTSKELLIEVTNEASKVTLIKQNEEGEVLAGAQFVLYQKIADAWTPIRTDEVLMSDESGQLVIEALVIGDYQLIETVAPSGYVVNTTPILFTVSANDNGFIAPIVLSPFMNYKGMVQLHKVDDLQQSLLGATFDLLDDRGIILQSNITVDENAMITIDHLSPGNYQFVETVAPQGYVLDSTPVSFTIASSAERKPIMVSVIKQNHKIDPPVDAGDSTNIMILAIVGGAAMLVIMGLIIYQKNRK